MLTILQVLCIATYAVGAAVGLGLLPESLSIVRTIALLLLAGHVIEAVVAFRYVKRYPGPLAVSLVLTLLFGFLHWWPYRRQAKEAATGTEAA
jgi:uncharacterized membrane protein HdeD (DUF308 family)